MNIALKIFRWLSVIALSTYALNSSWEILEIANHLSDNPGAGDFVSGWEERMKVVKLELPKEVTLIGYTADWDIPGVITNPIDQDNEYMLSQYALVPIKVVPGLEADWILGNFGTPSFQNWLDKSIKKYEIKSLGNQLYLIHRTYP